MQEDTRTAQPSTASPHADIVSQFIHYGVICLTIALIVSLVWWQTIAGRPQSLDLHYNPYVLLSVVALISNLVAFALIVRVKERTEISFWFAALLLCTTAWAAGEIMVRLSATPAAAVFWAPITTLGSVFAPAMLYMFALAYTNPKYSLQPYVLPGLLAVSTLLIYLDNHSQLITIYAPAKMTVTNWGYVAATGPAYIIILLWFMSLSIAAIGLLYRFRRQTTELTLRKQALLFMVAVAVPVIGGGVTNGLLPLFNVVVVPPLGVMLLTAMGIIISYGILKYNFFSFTPGLVANEILGTMNEAVFGMQPDFRISYVNNGAEELLDLPAAKLSGRYLSDFLKHSSVHSDLQEEFFKVLGEGSFGTIDSVDFHTMNGLDITTKLSITKLHNESQPYGYLVVMTDITAIAKAAAIVERQVADRTAELHQEQAKLRAAIEGLSLGFVMIDTDGHVLVQNQALRAVLDLSDKAGSVAEIDKHLGQFDLPAERQKAINTKQPRIIKDISLGAKAVNIFLGPVITNENGLQQTIGTVLLVEDITKEKELDRMKTELVTLASHQLRTPASAVKNTLSLLLDGYVGTFSAEQLRNLRQAYAENQFELKLIDGIIEVGEVDTNQVLINPTQVDLAKLMTGIVNDNQTFIKERKHRVTIDIPAATIVQADADKIRRVFERLITNAIQYTGPRGRIQIAAERSGSDVIITVSDTGIGVPAAELPDLFNRFSRASNAIKTNMAGPGLGLYLAKSIIELHHGHIELESQLGKGTIVRVTLPTK